MHNDNSTFSGFPQLERAQWVGFRREFKSLGTQLTESYNITFVLINFFDRGGFYDEENGADG